MNRHLSSKQLSKWVIGERSPEEDRHARECPRCRGELERLESAFSLFRDSGRRWSDHWYISASRNDSEYAQLRADQRVCHRVRLSLSGALLASVFVGAVLLHQPVPLSQRVQTPPRAGAEPPFIQIPYAAPLAPYERIEVTRMDVPIAALLAAGFEVHVADSAAVVRADVLMGQDGRPHAIRLISSSIPRSYRR
jgi:hypothetical protein